MTNRDHKTTMGRLNRGLATILLGATALAVTACESSKAVYPERDKMTGRRVFRDPSQDSQEPGLFGPGGLNLFGGNKETQPGTTGVGVNSFLWRAALDTIAFMPLTSADPFGGVIITDWYSPPKSPNERFKTNVYILAKALRADGVKVSVFRQVRDHNGAWVEAAVASNVATDMENAILTRARQLRLAVLTEK